MKPNFAQFAAPVDLIGDEPRRFTGVAYSGGLAHPASWGPCVVDLASTKIAAPLPLLFRHDHDMLSIGIVKVAQNDGRQVMDEGELHTDLDDDGGRIARGIADRAKKGEPWQQSLGLYGFSEENVPPQMTVEVNGRSFQGPLTVMRGGTVREITFAPLGADPETNAAVYAVEDTMHEVDSRVADLTAQLNGAQSQLTAKDREIEQLTNENKTVTAALQAANGRLAAVREAAVEALFAECGIPYDAIKAHPYLEMDQDIYDTVAENMRAAHKQAQQPADSSLFEHQAVGDTSPAAPATFKAPQLRPLADIYAHVRTAE